jgi:hypothetical protein
MVSAHSRLAVHRSAKIGGDQFAIAQKTGAEEWRRERWRRFPIPANLHGKRLLDIGVWDVLQLRSGTAPGPSDVGGPGGDSELPAHASAARVQAGVPQYGFVRQPGDGSGWPLPNRMRRAIVIETGYELMPPHSTRKSSLPAATSPGNSPLIWRGIRS